MTVNTTNITSGPYTGNGSSDEFSYTFRVDDASQLRVFETTDTGVETTLVLDVDYTVAGVGNDAGGVITRTAGNLPTDYQWYIRSDYETTQLRAFASQGGFFPGFHEDAIDKLTFLVQQLYDLNDRTFRISESDPDLSGVSTLPPAAERQNKVMSFDSLGVLIVTQELGDWKGDWVTATQYPVRSMFRDPVTSSVYYTVSTHVSTTIAADIISGYIEVLIDADIVGVEAAAQAAASASDALVSENAASASAAAALVSEINAASIVGSGNGQFINTVVTMDGVPVAISSHLGEFITQERNMIPATAAEANSWQGVTWSPELGLFAAVSATGINRVMTSPDGITWTARAHVGTNQWLNVTWASSLGLFVAVANDKTNRVMTSPDGITWTARAHASDGSWRDVAWSAELSLFVAVAQTGTNRVMTSPDGITWTARTAAEANQWMGVVWSAELSLFVAVAQTGINRVMTSPDGITWTARTAAEANNWGSLAWSPELGLLVAASNNGTNRVMTSPDGITWTARAAGTISAGGVAWSLKLGLFIIIASGNYLTSPDGITWTTRATPEVNSFSAITWSPELSRFVAVAFNGTDRVLTSM